MVFLDAAVRKALGDLPESFLNVRLNCDKD